MLSSAPILISLGLRESVFSIATPVTQQLEQTIFLKQYKFKVVLKKFTKQVIYIYKGPN